MIFGKKFMDKLKTVSKKLDSISGVVQALPDSPNNMKATVTYEDGKFVLGFLDTHKKVGGKRKIVIHKKRKKEAL